MNGFLWAGVILIVISLILAIAWAIWYKSLDPKLDVPVGVWVLLGFAILFFVIGLILMAIGAFWNPTVKRAIDVITNDSVPPQYKKYDYVPVQYQK